MILIKLRKKILSYAQMLAQEMGFFQAGDRKEKFAQVCFKFCVVLIQNNLYGCRVDEHKQCEFTQLGQAFCKSCH